MKQETTNISIGKWIKVTFAGWFLSIIAILALSALFDGIGIENLQCYLGIGMGLGIGYMQWRMLRRQPGISSKWLWYSVIGIGAPFLLFDLLKIFAGVQLGSNYILYSVCVSSILVGALQLLILKQYSTKAWLWIIACMMGWILSTGTVLLIDHTKFIQNNLVAFVVNLLLMLAGGPVLGVITGWFLKQMELKPKPIAAA